MSSSDPVVTLLRAICSIYLEEVTKEDREQVREIDLAEPGEIETEKVVSLIKVAAEDYSRTQAIKFAYNNLQRFERTFNDDVIILIIESFEYRELWQSGQPRTCIMRAASFFESYLIEKCALSPNTNLYHAINHAADAGLISSNEQRLLQFIREVRNDCGHNAWLKQDYHYEILSNTALAAVKVVRSIRMNRVDEYIEGILDNENRPTEQNLSEIVEALENRYRWEWDDENQRYEPIEDWVPPEDEYSF